MTRHERLERLYEYGLVFLTSGAVTFVILFSLVSGFVLAVPDAAMDRLRSRFRFTIQKDTT